MAESTDAQQPGCDKGSSPTISPKVAPPPFDKLNANLILRSSDWVDFRVRRGIMEEVSTMFEDMLSIPQPQGQDNSKDVGYDGDVPIVQLTEHSSVLLPVLQLCYPGLGSLSVPKDSIVAVYEASRKYMMDWPMKRTLDQLMEWAQTEPYRVYAIAAKFQSIDLLRFAAKQTLRFPNSIPYCEEWEDITAGTLHRLIKYRQAHVDAMMRQMRSLFIPRHFDDKYMVTFANRLWGTQWVWFGCKSNLFGRLTNTPAESTIAQLDIEPILQTALRCGHCKDRAKGDLESFRTALEAHLASVYASIELEIK
ncbi:hypothetical protein NLI96_g6160 [Meripilus lineatus]|uniref:BTB domain-containing protein n=1 Tax=Meripilus lineatus TaxID=2056292 RepID=A0AAD5YD93_9APHY|nr:hypothetical protein NLI96_g6160 [Physisporinus lineatus]